MPRSILVNPFARAGSSGAGNSARRPRRRVAPLAASLTAAALAALALAGPIATPAEASVEDRESYMRCVNAVADWTDACKKSSESIIGDAACVAVGTAGILGCAALEIIEQLGGGVNLS